MVSDLEILSDWSANIFVPFFSSLQRRQELLKIVKPDGIGIELGVAEGFFSELLLMENTLRFLYSVDMYAGDSGHDVEQYKRAYKRLDKFRDRNTILKMKFDEALDLYSDSYFDFIYVDGFAHTGEEGGSTFYDWFPKLKDGAVFAGHDYDPERWPTVVEQVDSFVKNINRKLHIIPDDSNEGWNQGHHSWFIIK